MSSNEIDAFLRDKLISYIIFINQGISKEELANYSLHFLVEIYCQSYAIPLESFANTLNILVKAYKTHYPDDDISDEEIYVLIDAFAPENFFGDVHDYYDCKLKNYNDEIYSKEKRLEELRAEKEIDESRLKIAKTSLEKSDIRSEIVSSTITINRIEEQLKGIDSLIKNNESKYSNFKEVMNKYFQFVNRENEENRSK